MSERIKAIIGLVLFIALLLGVTVFLNTRQEVNEQEKVSTSNENQKVLAVNENNFEEEVIKSNKKVLIDFYATWCIPCRTLSPIVEEITNENANLKVVKVDVDKCGDLVLKYGIQAMPTLIVIENGEEINRSVGAIPKEKILEICGIE